MTAIRRCGKRRTLPRISRHMLLLEIALALVLGFGIARIVDAATHVDYAE